MQKEYAELGGQEMASLLMYIADQEQGVPTGELSNVLDVISGWEARYATFFDGAYAPFRDAYYAYKNNGGAWSQVQTASVTLARRFATVSNLPSPLCQERTAEDRVCGASCTPQGACTQPDRHAIQ